MSDTTGRDDKNPPDERKFADSANEQARLRAEHAASWASTRSSRARTSPRATDPTSRPATTSTPEAGTARRATDTGSVTIAWPAGS